LLPLRVVLGDARGCARPFGELDLDVPGQRIHRARTEHADLGIDGAENVASEASLHGARSGRSTERM
jgi:hypothetical protein